MNYRKAHEQVKRLWGAAREYPCVGGCGKLAAHWAYDGTDRDDRLTIGNSCRYSIWPEFYMPMCAKCHRDFDLHWAERVRLLPPEPPKPLVTTPRTEAEWDAYLRRLRRVSCE